MKFVIQRVQKAEVTVDGKTISTIGPGLLVLVGIEMADELQEVMLSAQKLTQWRLFEGPTGKPDFNVVDQKGEILLVSQFTLCANLTKGRRPDFTAAMPPQRAKELYEALAKELSQLGVRVSMGSFGDYMHVSLCNDGPFTIIWETPKPGRVCI